MTILARKLFPEKLMSLSVQPTKVTNQPTYCAYLPTTTPTDWPMDWLIDWLIA